MSAGRRNTSSGSGSRPLGLDALVDLGVSHLPNPDSVLKVIEGIRVAAEAVREVAVQKREQERIRANAETEIAKVHAVRDVMLTYLDRSFDERRTNFDALFARLDVAIAQGNLEIVATTLDAVVELAKTSPFKDLSDVASARSALRDKSVEWDF